MWIDAFDDKIGKIFEVKRGVVFGLVVQTHGTKSPVHVVELSKTRRLGQEMICGELAREGGIFSLEELHHLIERLKIRLAQGVDALCVFGGDGPVFTGNIEE